jgi:hypothetical protein
MRKSTNRKVWRKEEPATLLVLAGKQPLDKKGADDAIFPLLLHVQIAAEEGLSDYTSTRLITTWLATSHDIAEHFNIDWLMKVTEDAAESCMAEQYAADEKHVNMSFGTIVKLRKMIQELLVVLPSIQAELFVRFYKDALHKWDDAMIEGNKLRAEEDAKISVDSDADNP